MRVVFRKTLILAAAAFGFISTVGGQTPVDPSDPATKREARNGAVYAMDHLPAAFWEFQSFRAAIRSTGKSPVLHGSASALLWGDTMPSFLITCTNATCAVPEAYRELFKGSEELVSSAEGWEPGALNLAQGLSMKFCTQLIHGDVTRLLIDLEQDGEKHWSKISAKLPEAMREKLVTRMAGKFRALIQQRLAEDFKRNEAAIHLLVHTAPLTDGSILFEYAGSDTAQKIAITSAKLLPQGEIDSRALAMTEPSPFVRWLIDSFASENYGVIRITVSQSFFLRSVPLRWETVKKHLIQALSNSTE